jgi:uncharacterized membrane protein
MVFLAHFFVAAMVGVIIDALWIAGVANSFYKKQLDRHLADRPNAVATVLFYLIYIWSILYFVVEPALLLHNLGWLLKHAAFLGLALYATYDLTNAATLKNWSAKLTIVDMLWGIFLTTAVSTATYLIFNQ